MKIFKTTAKKIIILTIVFLLVFNNLTFGGVNPPREEVENIIDTIAQKRAIPAILLKSIARVESCFEHYDHNGNPKINGTSIGLMQVNNRYGGYNTEKLKYDIEYNIEAGADVLLNKWSMSSYQSVSSVGNMDPNILENWYFALWAYNGWAQSNNPNMLSSYAKKYTYQQLVYNIAEKEYNKKINNIDFSYLPAAGKPSRSLVVPTPSNCSSGNIVLYEIGDYVRTDGIRKSYHLRDVPAGKYIHELDVNQLAVITEGPVLEKGYYWYKVSVDENKEGWIERNWLLRTGDIEYGRYTFEDISFHWARKIIMDLLKKDIVSEGEFFYPDNYVSKEEYFIMLSRSLDYSEVESENASDELKGGEELQKNGTSNETSESNPFEELEGIQINPWAVEYVENIYGIGLIDQEDLSNIMDNLTRKEAALITAKLFDIDEEFYSLDIKSIFTDLNELKEEEIAAVKTVYVNEVMSGKATGTFSPHEHLTRAEAAAIMAKVSEKLKTE
ncbi:MAG TPA: transglycosylase SLT domain-containing protein [Tissierellia bacterium]|jgi:hypothetical protein|nr:transglycosylase SLT domain-containing protein [Tissierellia bacterium]